MGQHSSIRRDGRELDLERPGLFFCRGREGDQHCTENIRLKRNEFIIEREREMYIPI